MTAMQEAVARGVHLLDEKNPGWENSIDLSRLNMNWPDWCILGQLYGGYDYGLHHFKLTEEDAFWLGFDVLCSLEDASNGENERRYHDLTNAWKGIILERENVHECC